MIFEITLLRCNCGKNLKSFAQLDKVTAWSVKYDFIHIEESSKNSIHEVDNLDFIYQICPVPK